MAQEISWSIVSFSIYMPVILLLLFKSTNAQYRYDCPNNTLFANNSQYAANLQTLFYYLSGNATNPTGFYEAVASNDNNEPSSETIYGSFLCQGDLAASACYDCVTTATTTDFPKKHCPNRKIAIAWYDNCMVRYSNQPFFGELEELPAFLMTNSDDVLGNKTRFEQLMRNMMYHVIATRAPYGGLKKKFATARTFYATYQTIYGLGQCTPDLSPDDCRLCLTNGVSQLPVLQGARYFQPSCLVRYELYPFFNLSSLPLAPQSLPTPRRKYT